MNNILAHPKTSLLGLLSAAGVIFSVLTANGVTGGKLGASTYVGIASALVAGLTGLMAKDWDSAPTKPEEKP